MENILYSKLKSFIDDNLAFKITFDLKQKLNKTTINYYKNIFALKKEEDSLIDYYGMPGHYSREFPNPKKIFSYYEKKFYGYFKFVDKQEPIDYLIPESIFKKSIELEDINGEKIKGILDYSTFDYIPNNIKYGEICFVEAHLVSKANKEIRIHKITKEAGPLCSFKKLPISYDEHNLQSLLDKIYSNYKQHYANGKRSEIGEMVWGDRKGFSTLKNTTSLFKDIEGNQKETIYSLIIVLDLNQYEKESLLQALHININENINYEDCVFNEIEKYRKEKVINPETCLQIFKLLLDYAKNTLITTIFNHFKNLQLSYDNIFNYEEKELFDIINYSSLFSLALNYINNQITNYNHKIYYIEHFINWYILLIGRTEINNKVDKALYEELNIVNIKQKLINILEGISEINEKTFGLIVNKLKKANVCNLSIKRIELIAFILENQFFEESEIEQICNLFNFKPFVHEPEDFTYYDFFDLSFYQFIDKEFFKNDYVFTSHLSIFSNARYFDDKLIKFNNSYNDFYHKKENYIISESIEKFEVFTLDLIHSYWEYRTAKIDEILEKKLSKNRKNCILSELIPNEIAINNVSINYNEINDIVYRLYLLSNFKFHDQYPIYFFKDNLHKHPMKIHNESLMLPNLRRLEVDFNNFVGDYNRFYKKNISCSFKQFINLLILSCILSHYGDKSKNTNILRKAAESIDRNYYYSIFLDSLFENRVKDQSFNINKFNFQHYEVLMDTFIQKEENKEMYIELFKQILTNISKINLFPEIEKGNIIFSFQKAILNETTINSWIDTIFNRKYKV